jgi:hypothetical protein
MKFEMNASPWLQWGCIALGANALSVSLQVLRCDEAICVEMQMLVALCALNFFTLSKFDHKK